MAVQVESWQRPQQRELRWDSVANCPDQSEMTQEVAHGHLMMVTSTGAGSPAHRHRHSIFARLYRTSAGQMLVLWPDKLHAPPIGCVTLKDTLVVSDESRSTITLRGHNDDDLPLTLICLTPDDYQRWKRAFTGVSTSSSSPSVANGRRKKFITNVVRLPMLIEEEL